MKQKNIKQIGYLLVIFCLITGCVESKKNKSIINSMESMTVVNDFKITLSTEKAEYERKELEEGVPPFHYKVELEYTGEKESIKIWHALDCIGVVSLISPEGEDLSEIVVDDILAFSNLEKNQAIIIDEWDGHYVIENPKNLKLGVYTVKAHINFCVGEDYKDKENLETIECVLNLPLVVQ